MTSVTWKRVPDDHDYPAAADYLALIAGPARVDDIVYRLRDAPIVVKKAKDILRAAALTLLPADNPHVAHDLAKVRDGHALSPVLIVRGDIDLGHPAHIADGYHRVCASFHLDENTPIPCRLVSASETPSAPTSDRPSASPAA